MPLDRDRVVRIDGDVVEAEAVEGRCRKARLVLFRNTEKSGYAVSRKEIAQNGL